MLYVLVHYVSCCHIKSVLIAKFVYRRWDVNEIWVFNSDGLTAEYWITQTNTCHSATLSTTNPKRSGLGSKPDLHIESPTTDLQSYDTVQSGSSSA